MKQTIWNRFSGWVNGTASVPAPKEENTAPENEKKRSGFHMDEARKLKLFTVSYYIVAAVVGITLVGILLYTIFNLPLFGAADNPAVNEVVERYVEKGLEETGAVNMVAGMILDYRAFDTFGESSVLFIAVSCVMMLLLRDQNNISKQEDLQEAHERVIERESSDLILKYITAVVAPIIILFGIYVVLNGHISPGGGFSGGAVMGAALILCSAAFGVEAVSKWITLKTFRTVTTTALLCYGASKAYSFFTGANGLPTGIPLGTPGAIFSSGLILVLDICVGFIVACTMYGFYVLFTKGDF